MLYCCAIPGARMSDSTADKVLAPVAPGERIHTLDVLRGFALLGIALVNVEFFTRPLQDINAPGIDPTSSGVDYFAEWMTYFFVQGKFWTMFALLFGMGFTVMIDRADRAGRPFVPAYLRRSLALLGIGLVHTVLIWSGDILVSYALGALLLLVARQVRRAWLRRSSGREPEPMAASRMGGWGAALYGLPLVVILLAGMLDSPRHRPLRRPSTRPASLRRPCSVPTPWRPTAAAASPMPSTSASSTRCGRWARCRSRRSGWSACS